jgi:hypothetical protein
MQKLILLLKELKGNFFISLIVLFAIVISVFSVGGFLVVQDNFNRYIRDRFGRTIPADTIRVSPKVPSTVSLLPFAFRKPKGSVLGEDTLMSFGEMQGVRRFYGVMSCQVPMQLIISIFGLSYRTDLVCLGVPYGFLAKDLKNEEYAGLWRNWKPGQKVPAVLPRMLLDSYNNSMAEPNGLPRITEDFAIGREVQILFGVSSIKRLAGFQGETGVVGGFTEKLNALALVLPLSTVKYYNKLFKGGTSDREYIAAYIETSDHTAVRRISESVRRMGYVVESDVALGQEIQDLRNNVNVVIQALMAIILALSSIGIAFSTVIATLDRVDYYRLLRVLGASKLFITVSLLVKYALYGFVGSVLGFFLLDWSAGQVIKSMKIPGFELHLLIPGGLRQTVILVGTLLPMVATIPAVIRLNFRGLTSD